MPSPHQIGPFEVLDRLGAGGMGEVFRARDSRLNRFVALKFLPEAASDAARERFQREALAIAALNHPHICTLHEIGEDHGRPFLVLELLEGETLKARLRHGLLAPDQLLDWGVQISDALDAAHRKGVLHRDLKPDNIWVSPGGHVKVLDFGLARLETDAGSGETVTSPMPLTSPGVAMGTYPYMSPEQAKGQPLDARSDVFSFGSVFYEMASGRPAFAGPSAAEVTAAILRGEPPRLSTLRPELPPRIEEVADRCLEKDPDLRFQSAADLRGELKRLKRESGSASAAVPLVPPKPPRRPWLWAAPAAAVVVAALAAWWWLRPRPAAPIQLQFRQLTFNGNLVDAVISPDGKFVAHVDNGPQGTSLHLLSVASNSDVQIMPPSPGCCQSPSFSPDGGSVYFLDNRLLQAIPVLGGAVRTVASPACSGAGFSPDGRQIAYLARTGVGTLMVAQPDGSNPRVLNTPASGHGYVSQCWITNPDAPTHAPAWSPDGRSIALVDGPVSGEGHLVLVSADSGRVRTLGPAIASTNPDLSWLSDGSGLIFTASIPISAAPQLFKVSYPGGRLTQLTNDLQGYTSASLSSSGQLLVVHAIPQSSIWVQDKPGGDFRQVPGGGATQDGRDGLAWTPQGGFIFLRNFGGKHQIWAEASDGSGAHPLLTENVPDYPYDFNVAPNGQILFGSNGEVANLWRLNADGSGLTPLLQLAPNAAAYTGTLIRGGRDVVYMYVDPSTDQTLWTVPLAGGTPRQLWSGHVYAGSGVASADGTRVLALTRSANNTPGISVIRIDGPTPQVTNSFDRPMQGPWRFTPDARAIVAVDRPGTVSNLWVYPLDGSKPRQLTHFTDLIIGAYQFSADGRLAIARGSLNSDAVLATGLAGH